MSVKFNYRDKEFEMDGIPSDLYYRRLAAGNFKFYEEPLLNYIESLGLTGTYLDVGANVGNHTVYFAVFCNPSRIFSIEPHKLAYPYLIKNCVKNISQYKNQKDLQCTMVTNVAMLDKCGKTSIKLYEPHNLGGTTVFKDLQENGTIDAITLDNFYEIRIAEFVNHPITFIKLDTEGCEIPIIRGGLNVIEKFKPVISAENHTPELLKEFMDLLKPYGYRITFTLNHTTHVFEAK